jgi:hypothetical protein
MQFGTVDHAFDEKWATIGIQAFLHDNLFIKSARAFATTAYNNYLQTEGKTIFVDKTPRYFHILPFLDELFPKARKIWLKRHPLDVALSYKKTWGIDTKIITGQITLPVSFDFAVGLFALISYFENSSPNKLEIQYETLVHSPRETLNRICRFIDIKFEEQMLNYAENQALTTQYNMAVMGDKNVLSTRAIHAHSVEKWSQELTPTEIEQMVALLGQDVFCQMGYCKTLETLQTLGIKLCSETEAAEARNRLRLSASDETTQKSQINQLFLANKELRSQLHQLQNSRSWRLTAPLRKIVTSLKELRRHQSVI